MIHCTSDLENRLLQLTRTKIDWAMYCLLGKWFHRTDFYRVWAATLLIHIRKPNELPLRFRLDVLIFLCHSFCVHTCDKLKPTHGLTIRTQSARLHVSCVSFWSGAPIVNRRTINHKKVPRYRLDNVAL